MHKEHFLTHGIDEFKLHSQHARDINISKMC